MNFLYYSYFLYISDIFIRVECKFGKSSEIVQKNLFNLRDQEVIELIKLAWMKFKYLLLATDIL